MSVLAVRPERFLQSVSGLSAVSLLASGGPMPPAELVRLHPLKNGDTLFPTDRNRQLRKHGSFSVSAVQ
ncbi:unnamed protein product [Boreogadus saida]